MLAKIALLVYGLLPIIIPVIMGSYLGWGENTKDPLWIGLSAFAYLSIPVLWAYYITHVVRNANLERSSKILWVVFLIFGHVSAFAFYWFIHYRRDGSRPAHD